MTRVGIDLRILRYARTGFYRYASGLLGALAGRPLGDVRPVLLHHPEHRVGDLNARGWEQVALATPLFAPREGELLARELRPLALDAIHFPCSLFPGRVTARTLLTIHDTACLRHPECVEEGYRGAYVRAIREAGDADVVATDSRTVAAELEAEGVPCERIRVCQPLTPLEGNGSQGMAPRAETPGEPLILAVGSLEPRKNHLGLLHAFEELVRTAPVRPRLVLVGAHGWLEDELHAAVGSSPVAGSVTVERSADDARLAELLSRCSVFVNLSLYEGFGLPVLEALATGACVLSSPVPSLTEAGFPAAGIVDPADPAAVACVMARLLGDPVARTELARRSQAAVASYYTALDPGRFHTLYRTVAHARP